MHAVFKKEGLSTDRRNCERKQWLPNGVFFTLAVLSSEKAKSERKPDSEHMPGLHEEDSMDCQSSKENLS